MLLMQTTMKIHRLFLKMLGTQMYAWTHGQEDI
jgi:hypothetical protein